MRRRVGRDVLRRLRRRREPRLAVRLDGRRDRPGQARAVAGTRDLRGDLQATSAQVDFDVWIDAAGTLQAYLVFLGFVSGSAQWFAQLIVHADGAMLLSEDLQGVGPEVGGKIACGQLEPKSWHHVQLAFDLAADAGAPTERLAIDGAPRCRRPITYASKMPPPYQTSVHVGLPFADPQTGTWSVFHDSVVVRVR